MNDYSRKILCALWGYRVSATEPLGIWGIPSETRKFYLVLAAYNPAVAKDLRGSWNPLSLQLPLCSAWVGSPSF